MDDRLIMPTNEYEYPMMARAQKNAPKKTGGHADLQTQQEEVELNSAKRLLESISKKAKTTNNTIQKTAGQRNK